MSFFDFFKKKPKIKQSSNTDVITFRDNYSTLNTIYKGSSYALKENTDTLILDLLDFDYFWNKYIVNHKKYLDKYDQSFVTIRLINENSEYIYGETIREKTTLDKFHLNKINSTNKDKKELNFFTHGVIEVGFWDFSTKSFTPVWSAKYTS